MSDVFLLFSAPQIVHAGLISLGVGNVGWFLLMCVIPVRYSAPRIFAIVSTEREECVQKEKAC